MKAQASSSSPVLDQYRHTQLQARLQVQSVRTVRRFSGQIPHAPPAVTTMSVTNPAASPSKEPQ
jgi:hypothetical protein